MGALAGDFSWTMEDDFRLRKAAETGTSLESLARGDVKFSKRFTFQELQDRWLAILYDPVVAAESSARMLEFEHADSAPVIKTDHLGNVEEDLIPVCVKRKPESIRKRFYAMQKKIRRDNLPAEPPVLDICAPLQNEPFDSMTFEPGHNTDIVKLDVNQYEEESDGFEEILELLEAKGPELLPPIIDEPIQNIQNDNLVGAELDNQMCCDDMATGVTNSTNSYLINDLFDLTMEEDDLPLMDADGNLIDASYLDDMSSRWLDSPNAKHDTVLVDEFLDNNNNNNNNYCNNNMGQSECDNQETKTLDGLLMTPFIPPVTSAIICTLNTEDPDIPSNDDVFLLNLVPSTSQDMQMDAFKRLLPPQLTSKSRVTKQIIPKINRCEQSQFSSPIIGSQFRSEVQVDHRIKHDFCNEDRSAIISRSNLFPASEKVTVNSEQGMHNFSSVRTVFDNKTGGSDILTNHVQLNPIATVQQETLNVEIVSSEVNNSCLINEEAISSQNDDDGDVFLLNLVPSTSQDMQMDAFKRLLPPQLTSKSRVTKQIIPKINRCEQSQFSSPIIGSQFRSEVQVDHRIKHDFCNEDRSAIISRSNLFPASEKVTVNSEQGMHNFSSVRTVFDNKTGGSDILTNHVQLNPIATVQQETLNVEIVSSEVNNSCLINEEAISSQNDDDGDYDMPSFSDVEAMILDEDASLDEQHLYLNRIGSSELLQTFIYENAETRKAIMRLEQAADAFVKRDIKSHGAFAILQGRHVKYYVKKPEVLIGRATEEFHVDIDLGREGQNTRVSRRQAILHMDHEGSFHMKNLSKYSIFINNIELATNQSITLTSSCLIEIKGMAFLFETNGSCIKQYVNSMKNKTVTVD